MPHSPRHPGALQGRAPEITPLRRAKLRRLDVRLSSADHARIVDEAARRGLSVSAYARQALFGQIDQARDRDAHLAAMLARLLDVRAEALAEMIGEVALTLVERLASKPITPDEQHGYVAGAIECFRGALRRHLEEGRG